MNTFRVIVVAFVAMSVAILPLGGGIVHAASHSATEATSSMTEHGDCCDHGKPCERKKSDDCGSAAGCLLKCSSLSATIAATSAASQIPLVAEKTNFIVESLGSLRDNPPSPPPRV